MGNSHVKRDDVEDDVGTVKNKDPRKAIIEKVLANPIYSEKLKNDPATLNRFAEVLCTKEELIKTYLTTDWVETVKLYNKIKESTNESAAKQNTSMFSSQAYVPSGSGDETDDDEDEKITEEQLQQSMDPEIKLKNKIKIKLIISEVASSSARKNFRKFISPVLSKLDLLPEFGMFHSGLMVGPWLIEWNNSALCVPRKCVSKAALLTADLDAIDTSQKVDEVIDKLAEVIVDWNINMGYRDHQGDKSKEGNCQDFVLDVLHRLNIKMEFAGPMGEFLKTLREKGTCELCFICDADFKEKFKITSKKVTFQTHQELDQFVANLVKIDPEFETTYKNEWMLLKSFDRALWLRHYKFPNDQKWVPYKLEASDDDGMTTLELACPFNDPEATYSIRFLK